MENNNNNNNQPKQPKTDLDNKQKQFSAPKQSNPVNSKPVQKNYKLKENTGNQVADFAAGLWNKSIDNQPKQKKLTDSNPFKGTNIPGFNDMENTWDDLMGAGQKVIDNGKALKKMEPKDNDLDDDALINRSIDNLIKHAKKSYGDKRSVEDLRGTINKEWSEDLAYQLKNDGVPEEKIQGLVKKFVDSAPTREEVNDKILNQMGLNNNEISKQNIMDRYNKLSDEQKKDFVLNVFNHTTDGFDNPIGKFKDPYTGEIMYADAGNDYQKMDDYLLNNDGQMEERLDSLINGGATQEDLEKLFNEYPTQDLEPYDEEDDSKSEVKQEGQDNFLKPFNENAKYSTKQGKEFEKEIRNFVNSLGQIGDVKFDLGIYYDKYTKKPHFSIVPYSNSNNDEAEEKSLDKLEEAFTKAGYSAFIQNNHGHITVYPKKDVNKNSNSKVLNQMGLGEEETENGNSKNEKFAPNDYSTEFAQQEIDDFLKTIDDKTDSFPQGNPKRKKKVFVNKEERDAFMKSLPESAEARMDEFDHTWTDENGDPDRWLTYWEVYYDEPNDKPNNSKVLNQMGLDDEDKINDDIYNTVNSNSKWFDDYASKNKIQDEDDFHYMIDQFIDTKLPEQYRNIPDLHDKVVDWFNNMKDWEENGGDYKAALNQMGLNEENETPEERKQRLLYETYDDFRNKAFDDLKQLGDVEIEDAGAFNEGREGEYFIFDNNPTGKQVSTQDLINKIQEILKNYPNLDYRIVPASGWNYMDREIPAYKLKLKPKYNN